MFLRFRHWFGPGTNIETAMRELGGFWWLRGISSVRDGRCGLRAAEPSNGPFASTSRDVGTNNDHRHSSWSLSTATAPANAAKRKGRRMLPEVELQENPASQSLSVVIGHPITHMVLFRIFHQPLRGERRPLFVRVIRKHDLGEVPLLEDRLLKLWRRTLMERERGNQLIDHE